MNMEKTISGFPPRRGRGRPSRQESNEVAAMRGERGVGAEVVPLGSSGALVGIPTFQIFKSDDPVEFRRENGARLIEDAYGRASAPKDGFDKMVYLALLAKDLTDQGKMKPIIGAREAKARKRALENLLSKAQDVEFREVK